MACTYRPDCPHLRWCPFGGILSGLPDYDKYGLCALKDVELGEYSEDLLMECADRPALLGEVGPTTVDEFIQWTKK